MMKDQRDGDGGWDSATAAILSRGSFQAAVAEESV